MIQQYGAGGVPLDEAGNPLPQSPYGGTSSNPLNPGYGSPVTAAVSNPYGSTAGTPNTVGTVDEGGQQLPTAYVTPPGGSIATQVYTPGTGQADPSAWGSFTTGQGVDPSQYAQVVTALRAQGGWNTGTEDPNYWVNRIASTNGGWGNPDNVKYYMDRIAAGPNGQPSDSPSASGGGGLPPAQFANGPLTDPNATALFNQLMKTSQESLSVSPNDPIIKSQTDAYSADQQRQMLAEQQQFSAGHGPFTDLSAEIAATNEKAGQNTAGYQATLMGNEVTARRQEIQSALSGAQGLLTAEQQMQLQEELDRLNLQEQAYQFDTSTNNSMITALTA